MVKQWLTRALAGRTAVSNALTDERPDASFEATWRDTVRKRMLVMALIVGGWGVLLEARLVTLQVIQHERWAKRALAQQGQALEIPGVRGDIVDRTGQYLALTVPGWEVFVDQKAANQEKLDEEAAEICEALRDCGPKGVAELAQKLKGTSGYVPIRAASTTTQEVVPRIKEMNRRRSKLKKSIIVGVRQEQVRFYPKRDLAAHVLGFVDSQGKGAAGIEASYNSTIAGAPGVIHVQVDGLSRDRQYATEVMREPTIGAGLELTIHAPLQHFMERELEQTVRAERAKGGTAIVMDPYTGELLGVANWPTFNPNTYKEFPEAFWFNNAVQGAYAPGSTFKIVTAAAALSEGLYSPATLIDTAPGYLSVPKRGKLITEDNGKKYGVLSFEDVIVKSSNVGAVMVGNRIGTERLSLWTNRMGFGEKLIDDLPGASKGLVKPASRLDDSGRASVSMGYEIAVTPIQLAAATSVIANGGVLVKPRIVRAIRHPNGRREVVEPTALRRVLDPEVAATMTAIMESVVERGTGKSAGLERYHVAGKTGTAQHYSKGGYNDVDYDVSFTGFFPSRRPAFTILVIVDRPQVHKYGGSVAAPLFRKIAEAAVQLVGIPPSLNPETPVIRAAAPPPAPRPASAPSVTLVGGAPVMPDLTGMSLREALRMANKLNIRVSAEGSGSVYAQSPAAGTVLQPGVQGVLRLKRLSPAERSESR